MRIWAEGGIPVMGSNLTFSWEMVQDGLTRLSEEAALEITKIGTSRGARLVMIRDKSGE